MKAILLSRPLALIGAALLLLASAGFAAESTNPYLGAWALTIPGGGAGWLGVTEDHGKLAASILWGGGSVLPVDGVKVQDGKLVVTRLQKIQRKNAQGKVARKKAKGKGKAANGVITETITAVAEGDNLKLETVKTRPDDSQFGQASFTGKRIAPLPPAPDLAKVKFGEPLELFNGKDFTGWKLVDPKAVSGWSVKDGVMTNNPAQEEGKPHKNYGNLRTEKEFEDFNLTLETNVPKGGNSGIYLRGIYEIQVCDSYGKALDPHNMGALYSRITPSKAAEKPAGEWQTFDITLVDRHITVILNGKKIIDNKPVLGCTGGALWSDQTRPGPIYLQGDHTGANYRNIKLRPVVK